MPILGDADYKAIFFDELDALGQLSEEEVNTDGVHQIPTSGATRDAPITSSQVSSVNPSPDCVNQIHSVRHTASQSIPKSHNGTVAPADNTVPHSNSRELITAASVLSTSGNSYDEETPSVSQDIQQRRASHRTASAQTSSNIVSSRGMDKSSLGKRKRKELPLKCVPAAQQIFLGCNFFFIPNDDIAPMRRARIRKAQEHGAAWCSEWGSAITHIIVDKSLSYDDIISFLGIHSIPKNMVMTNETYPIDCFQFKAILDPKQRQYRVKGHEKALEDEATRHSSQQTANMSLQPHPIQSKFEQYGSIPPQGTPPGSETLMQNFLKERPLETQPEDTAANNGVEPDSGSGENESIPTAWRAPISTDGTLHNEESDALEEMIREARTMMHLPLDDDDDLDRPPSQDETLEKDRTSDEEISGSPSKARVSTTKRFTKGALDQKNFSCMKGGSSITDTSNPNSRTIAVLQEMADYYTRINDTWRPIAYRKAISTLRQQPRKIITAAEALDLQCVGHRLACKIEEIVTTDRLRRLENAKSEPGDYVLQKFLGIYGVGFSQASKWLHSGYKTLEDLKTSAHLTDNQLLGIEHYEDFNVRIPREEVTALGDIVKLAAINIDPKVEIIIGGSYRRGAATSGDIDCIITKPKTSASNDLFSFLTKLTTKLTSCNFLVAALAVPRAESGSKWHGCCVLPGKSNPVWRRIDFLLVPASELGAALIYFTGNDIFNRSVRLLASRKGMRLNQRGLYKNVMRGPGRTKLNEGELVEGEDEKKIFATLGVPWRPPEQRIC